MQVEQLTPTLGAEVSGADLNNVTDQQFSELHELFVRYGVLFFRDQPELAPAAQVAGDSRLQRAMAGVRVLPVRQGAAEVAGAATLLCRHHTRRHK